MARSVTRLFSQFSPTHYDLHITIAEDKQSFAGTLTVTGQRRGRPSKRITLHQNSLTIDSATIEKIDKKQTSSIEVSRIVHQNKRDEVRLHSDTDIFPGEYKLTLQFSGPITKNMNGIYPCFYTEDGEEKQLIATQFESHHAREVFPCIDEPEAKATFDLTLTHDANETALGNTPIVNAQDEGGRRTTRFETTPMMSTYLLAFVVGDVEYKEALSSRGVKIRTYATPQQVQHTDFALDVAVKCMDFYEDYYDIPFPLEKCDFIALPDFASGAMENWGLITFREQTLLMDTENTSLSTKQYVAIVVAHELTHQWFGNLVTMRWWTDLWLNEGFASWMEYLAIDSLFPEWNLWTQFTVDEQQMALKADALENTHPIEVPVKHPDEIRSIFDIISYQKGASVIHMLHDYLGPEGFRDGLRHYLKTHSYKNTDTVDLWQALEDVTKKPVKDFMGAWTSKSGFPLIEAEYENDHLKLTQKRFIANPNSTEKSDTTLWPVPLLTPGIEQPIAAKKVTNIPTAKAPLKINVGQGGFYRVNYSHDIQADQLAALKANKFDDVDRMALLADSFEVTKAGYQSINEFLDLLDAYRDESALAVWEIIASSIGSIRSGLSANDEDDTLRDNMKPYIRSFVASELKRLGWEPKADESHLDSLLRPTILGLAAGADDDSVVARARELFTETINGTGSIHPDLRAIVYATVARHGGQAEMDTMKKLYENSTSSDEKLALTVGLTAFEQPDIHAQIRELITSGFVRLQDIGYWIAYSFMNRHARKETWLWLKDTWPWLKKNLGTDLSFSRMPVYAARTFAHQELLDDYKSFFEQNMEPMIERAYRQGLEMAETSTAWRKRDAENALNWFKNAN